MSRIAWPTLIRAGISGLGLKPDEFWRLTPAELMLLLGAGSNQGPMTRAGLEELEQRFPDLKEDPRDGGSR
ncbi:MAG: rcc01693 family protein [Pseudomonadota bacterium]